MIKILRCRFAFRLQIYTFFDNNYKFIKKSINTYVIDYYGRVVAELETTHNPFIMNDIFYYRWDKSLFAIDLKNLEP